jgi:chaperone BCS1
VRVKAVRLRFIIIIFYFSLITSSVVARNNDILKRLVLEAKREYEKDAEHRVHIFMADT